MDVGLKSGNGLPLYLLGKLTNDFDPIFCRAHNKSISFLGARDRLAIILKIVDSSIRLFENETDPGWDFSYAFESNEVKRNIKWFMTKSNANKKMLLNMMPYEDRLEISAKVGSANVEAKLTSFIKDAPIPRIQEMDDGILIRITDLKELVEQLGSIEGEVVELKYHGTKLELKSIEHEYPTYTIPIAIDLDIGGESQEKITFCLKQMMLISCQLAAELESRFTELKFYPGGATQINSDGNSISVHCILTTVKV